MRTSLEGYPGNGWSDCQNCIFCVCFINALVNFFKTSNENTFLLEMRKVLIRNLHMILSSKDKNHVNR